MVPQTRPRRLQARKNSAPKTGRVGDTALARCSLFGMSPGTARIRREGRRSRTDEPSAPSPLVARLRRGECHHPWDEPSGQLLSRRVSALRRPRPSRPVPVPRKLRRRTSRVSLTRVTRPGAGSDRAAGTTGSLVESQGKAVFLKALKV